MMVQRQETVIMLVYSAMKNIELEARVLGVKATDQLLLRLGKIERNAVRFCDGGHEKAEEAQNLWPDIPPEKAALRVVRLGVNDIAQIEAASHQKDTNY